MNLVNFVGTRNDWLYLEHYTTFFGKGLGELMAVNRFVPGFVTYNTPQDRDTEEYIEGVMALAKENDPSCIVVNPKGVGLVRKEEVVITTENYDLLGYKDVFNFRKDCYEGLFDRLKEEKVPVIVSGSILTDSVFADLILKPCLDRGLPFIDNTKKTKKFLREVYRIYEQSRYDQGVGEFLDNRKTISQHINVY